MLGAKDWEEDRAKMEARWVASHVKAIEEWRDLREGSGARAARSTPSPWNRGA
jgi:hypothetical protein